VSLVTLSLNDTYLMEAGIVHRGVSFEPLHLLGLLPMLLRDYLRPVIILRVGMSDEDVGCLGQVFVRYLRDHCLDAQLLDE
jgi:hypothetical protein